MPTFAYKARNRTGEQVSGTLMAETAAAAARMLDERALLPVQVDEVPSQQRSVFTGRARRISPSKIGILYEQLADLLRAGVPMLRALDVLSKQASTPALAQVLREVRDDVAGGDALADAMERHPQAFSSLHASMVRAGEKGGFVEDVLGRLSEFVARQDALRNKFIGAMIYPAVLFFGAIGAVTFIMAFVVPKIRPVLMDQGELPWPTLVVFGVSDAMQNYYGLIIGVALVLIVAVVGFFQSAAGKLALARLQLRAFVVGPVFTMISVCRFCRIFGTLLGNGIPILQALKIAKDSTGNVILAETIDAAAENVRAGESLAAPLGASKLFPPAIIDMIAVAEESNTLEKVLVEIANTQEERTARQIDLTVRLLEPLMLLFMGGMIAFIAIALLVPILRMATSGFKN